jgi:hypothetical protein
MLTNPWLFPGRVYYTLSDLGRSLVEPPGVLQQWANGNMAVVDQCRRSYDDGVQGSHGPSGRSGKRWHLDRF